MCTKTNYIIVYIPDSKQEFWMGPTWKNNNTFQWPYKHDQFWDHLYDQQNTLFQDEYTFINDTVIYVLPWIYLSMAVAIKENISSSLFVNMYILFYPVIFWYNHQQHQLHCLQRPFQKHDLTLNKQMPLEHLSYIKDIAIASEVTRRNDMCFFVI